jgi:hypothetical protein
MLAQAAVGPESHSRPDGNMWREAGLEPGIGGAAIPHQRQFDNFGISEILLDGGAKSAL